jgi:hypothetical protein
MPLAGRPTVGISVNLHALSRGTVNIDPQIPEGEPVVDYRAMSHPLDSAIMADRLRYLRIYYLQILRRPGTRLSRWLLGQMPRAMPNQSPTLPKLCVQPCGIHQEHAQ